MKWSVEGENEKNASVYSLLSPISHLSRFAPQEDNSPIVLPCTFHGASPGPLASVLEERVYVCPVVWHFVLSESGGANLCSREDVWSCRSGAAVLILGNSAEAEASSPGGECGLWRERSS